MSYTIQQVFNKFRDDYLKKYKPSLEQTKDRHCPNCQNYQKERWIDDHKNDIFNTPYYHIVTTVPKELHGLFYHNKEEMYNMLFKASTDTVIELARKNILVQK